MVNAILAKRVNHIVTKGDNPAWPKGSKSCGFSTPKEIACIDKKEFSPIDIFSRKEAILKAYYTAYNKLCNWIDIDTTNVSKASNVTIICMLKKILL